MKITRDAGGSIYSVGEEGGGYVYVSIQYATVYPSASIKHAANLLRVMRNSIVTNESSYPFYLGGL